jgi:hypothetical protein
MAFLKSAVFVLAATSAFGGFSSGSSITSQLAVLSWNQFLLF